MNKDNDPFRLPDPYDGVPADTIPPRPRDPSEDYDLSGEIVEPVSERAAYARLVVWPDGDFDLFSFDCGARGKNLSSVTEWNARGDSGKAFLVRVTVPTVK